MKNTNKACFLADVVQIENAEENKEDDGVTNL